LVADTIAQLVILGALPLLWVRLRSPGLGWQPILHPLPSGGPRSVLLGWVIGALFCLLVWVLPSAYHLPQTTHAPPILMPVVLLLAASLEEGLFRGYLLGRLTLRLGPTGGMLTQALAFTGLHSLGWALFNPLPSLTHLAWAALTFAFALVTGVLVRLQGGLGAAIVVHLVVNSLRYAAG
jgi:membrane protease YdiL (CAAX protease family)